MITTYHRPQTLDEALALLTQPNRIPLGGGTVLSQPSADSVEVVDLQALSLNTLKRNGNSPSAGTGQRLEIGATVTLQQLLESDLCPETLKSALKLEAPLNIRNAATVAGTLVACDGRSPCAAMLLALDAKITLSRKEQSEEILNIGEILPVREQIRGKLITKITIPLNVKTAFDYVARTPADKPIVSAALAQWNSGRTRLALTGYGRSPLLAMDGTEAEGLESAARNAFHEANDEWASAEYRMDVASVLAQRCLASLHA